MRIAYVITRADAVGGATIHVRDLACAMRGLGHEPLILVGGRGPVTERFEAAGLRVHPLGHLRRVLHPVDDLLALGELTRVIGDFAPDLVSTHTAKAGWLGRAAAARLGIPAIYTPHGLPVGGRFPAAAGPFFTLAERVASRWGAAIVCVSEAERRLAISGRIAPPDRLFVVHNGVRDIAPEFRACPDREPVSMCSVARFERPKDFATLMAAVSRLADRDWTLELAGDGPLEGEIRRLAKAHGIAKRVRFLGYQPDPAPVFARSQLFVLASRSEAFPRSILEAMRAGLPVVASDVGGVGEAVSHGTTGLLVPPRDPARMAAAIGELLSAGGLRREMGDRARGVFEQGFGLERTVEQMLALYSGVLNRLKFRT